MTPNSTASLSVIIPTLNEELFIGTLLDNLLTQDNFSEIIVSDSGSTDKTGEIVQEFKKKHPGIKYVQAPKKGHGLARNFGTQNATGEYLFFLDADINLPPNFLKNALEEAQKRKLDGASVYLRPSSHRFIDKITYFFQQHVLARFLQYTPIPVGAGAALLVKRTMHEKIGGFDENLKYNEDLFYTKNLSRLGKYRMLNSTYITVSMRRFDSEGRLKLWCKYVLIGLSYLFNIKETKVDYEFGTFNEKATTKEKVDNND